MVNDKKIKELNNKYAGKNSPTDVLGFDISRAKDEKHMLADIIISTDAVMRNSRIFKTTCPYELYLYVIHGILHLLGYEDKTTAQKNIMQKKAQKILALILDT